MFLTIRNSTNYKNIYEMLRLSSCPALLSTLALAGSLCATSAHADDTSPENKATIDSILAGYQAECTAEQAYYRTTEEDEASSQVGELKVPEGTIYQIDLDVAGKTATVIYPEFRCENAGWKWCGTGGCGFHLVVDGMNFQRKDGFRPQSIRFPTPIGEDVAVIYAVHGTQCKTPSEEYVTGSDYCYSTAIWNEPLGTFLSRDERLLDMDPSLP